MVAPSQRWLYTQQQPLHYTFNTPVGAQPNQQCGRVLFSDFHVTNSITGGTVFPAECDNKPLSAQEKILEFMLFDLASCIQPENSLSSCLSASSARATGSSAASPAATAVNAARNLFGGMMTS